jgi:hypothetical protein
MALLSKSSIATGKAAARRPAVAVRAARDSWCVAHTQQHCLASPVDRTCPSARSPVDTPRTLGPLLRSCLMRGMSNRQVPRSQRPQAPGRLPGCVPLARISQDRREL